MDKLKQAVYADLNKVQQIMQRNDPNGTYTIDSLVRMPVAHIEVLEQWKQDMGDEATEQELILFDELISFLWVLALALDL